MGKWWFILRIDLDDLFEHRSQLMLPGKVLPVLVASSLCCYTLQSTAIQLQIIFDDSEQLRLVVCCKNAKSWFSLDIVMAWLVITLPYVVVPIQLNAPKFYCIVWLWEAHRSVSGALAKAINLVS